MSASFNDDLVFAHNHDDAQAKRQSKSSPRPGNKRKQPRRFRKQNDPLMISLTFEVCLFISRHCVDCLLIILALQRIKLTLKRPSRPSVSKWDYRPDFGIQRNEIPRKWVCCELYALDWAKELRLPFRRPGCYCAGRLQL
jgi:hypothetical protein